MAAIDTANYSAVQISRLAYAPPLPQVLADVRGARVTEGAATAARTAADAAALSTWFPTLLGQRIINIAADGAGSSADGSASKALRVGVVFCGRQCPGGHNVVAGLYDALKALNSSNVLLGAMGGTEGLFRSKVVELSAASIAPYRNQGGYHMLGRSVDRIRSAREQQQALEACASLNLDGLVLLGGTYTNTDAAHLAEYFSGKGCRTAVVGVPATIDGDLKSSQFIEASLGFDTATKITSQLLGNLETDCNSAKKYVYFARVLGRAGGHIALECALQTHPNVLLLGEDIEARKLTLNDVVSEVADVLAARAAEGKHFGVVVIPEGLISAIPELRTLINEMNVLLTEQGVAPEELPARLTPWSKALLNFLPPVIRDQLFLERESSGAVQLSQISTERLLLELVNDELSRRKSAGAFKGKTGNGMAFFFGYQARSALPSNFDCAYGQALGYTAALLVSGRRNGYLASVRNLNKPVSEWEPLGVPLTALLSVPVPGSASVATQAIVPADAGAQKGIRPAILPATVDVLGGPFKSYAANRSTWALADRYTNPGPIQFAGSTADDVTATLAGERHDYFTRLALLQAKLDRMRSALIPGISDALLDAALSGVSSLDSILSSLGGMASS